MLIEVTRDSLIVNGEPWDHRDNGFVITAIINGTRFHIEINRYHPASLSIDDAMAAECSVVICFKTHTQYNFDGMPTRNGVAIRKGCVVFRDKSVYAIDSSGIDITSLVHAHHYNRGLMWS